MSKLSACRVSGITCIGGLHMPVIIGPDGFVCARNDPRCAHHAVLNDMLCEIATQPAKAHAIAAAAVGRLRKERGKQELVALSMTACERVLWIREHADEIAQATEWARRVWTICYHLYSLRLPFTASEMCQLIDTPHAEPPVGRVVEYFHEHGLTPQLCAALRKWREVYRSGIGNGYRHVDVQNELQLLDMMLWHDEWDEVVPAACWSERIRRDFRNMRGERQQAWRALLHHIRGDAGSKPPKLWVKQAENHLAAIGQSDFCATMTDWFGSFRDPEPLRLSIVGSHVLKGLLWYCAVAHDPTVTASALPLLDATWKPKRNLDKVMVALAVLIDTMPVEEAWAALLPLQSAWGASQGRIEQLVRKIAAAVGICEEDLRATRVLKPTPAKPAEKPSVKVLVMAGPLPSAKAFRSEG